MHDSQRMLCAAFPFASQELQRYVNDTPAAPTRKDKDSKRQRKRLW